jgi:NADH:ubiquinone oxidoreductase subunit K
VRLPPEPFSILHPAASKEETMSPLAGYLILSAFLFAIGLAGALTRRNAIIVLIGIELMLNAANLNFIAFWRFSDHPEALTGIMFVIFSIGVAAAEAAVGLALIIAIYRHYKTANVDEVNSLKG